PQSLNNIQQQQPAFNCTSAIWDSVNTHTPIDNHQYLLGPTSQSSPSSPSSPSDFSIFSFSTFFTTHAFRAANQRCSPGNSPAGPDTVEENPTASRTTTTDTHTAAISSTPTPTHISYIGSDDILTVLLGGSLPGTNTAGNTEACPGQQWLTVRPKTVQQLLVCSDGDSASLQKYVTRQLLDTSGFFKDPSFDQSRAHGTRYLMLARMDALWTAGKAIQIGILVDTHPFSVDHCILCDQQLLSTSIAHLVVECEQVTGHRIQSGLVPAIQKSRLRLLGRALDPGVENVYTWLRGGVLNGQSRSGPTLVVRGLWSMDLWGRGMIIG
ncbi:hypothetical protein BASA62_001002, partial [Batrachochytrium salamandrivorans]